MSRSTASKNSTGRGFLALLALIALVAILTILLTMAQARARMGSPFDSWDRDLPDAVAVLLSSREAALSSPHSQ